MEPATACKNLEKYNEVQGVVLCCTGGGGLGPRMAYIQLPSELGDRVPQVPAEWLQPLRAGSMVTLTGLEDCRSRHLTGAHANVYTGFLEESDEMDVAFADGTGMRLGIECLTPIPRIKNLNLQGSMPYLRWRRQQICTFLDESGATRQFSVHLPCGFRERFEEARRIGQQASPWPMLYYMHGAGGRAMFDAQDYIDSAGFQFAAKKFVVICPQHTSRSWKVRPKTWVEQLFRYLRAASWIDSNRCYISGMSMGGRGCWELASNVKDIVAAVAPIAAHHHVGRTEHIAEQLSRVPVLALSSISDTCCRIGPERALWRRLLAKGNDRLVAAIVRDVEHEDMFEAAYCRETALYDWLLAHRLGA